ncbi:response regulator [Flavobacterium sp. RHBU_3]|uniref:response regulator n=1 Tax=Flavobacterium sp. RHBU_3 TaxID=3391184 RepID=UPI0039854993
MNAHIILIDDDDDDRLLFREAITSTGFSGVFSEHHSGKSFIDYMDNTDAVTPCLIFLDINMPAIDGYTLLKIIRGNRSFGNSNVVMYTTGNNHFDVQFAEHSQASGFAAKPRDYHRLEEIIQNAVQQFLPPKEPMDFFCMT